MGSPDCQGIPRAMGVFVGMALSAWDLTATLAAVSDGLESGMCGVFLCRSL